jgi:hypothetical protein
MPTIDQELEQERLANKQLAERIQGLEQENAQLTARGEMQRLESERENARLERALALATPTICGTNPILPAERVGCGHAILNETDCYRCVDCGVPFHRECLHKHCKSELDVARQALQQIAERLPSEKLQAVILSHEPKASEREWHKRLWDLEKIANDALTGNTVEQPKGA